MLLDSEVVQVNPVKMVPKESQAHAVNVVKLVLQVSQDLKVKMAKMARLENQVQTDFRELPEKGVHLDSEDLLEQMAFQEKGSRWGAWWSRPCRAQRSSWRTRPRWCPRRSRNEGHARKPRRARQRWETRASRKSRRKWSTRSSRPVWSPRSAWRHGFPWS